MLSADELILLEKAETVYGQDPTPAGATDAVLTKNFQITPLDASAVSRNLDKAESQADPELLTGIHVSISYDVELAASGTSGAGITKPAWADMLEACAFDVTVDTTPASEHVDFTLATLSDQDALTSVTGYANLSGQLHKYLGARGGWSIDVSPEGIPMISIQRKGLYVAPASAAAPTGVFTSWQDPLVVDNDNTPTIDFFGYSCVLFGLQIQGGITPQIFNVPGEESVRIPERRITGKIVIAAPKITTEKDFFAVAKAHTLGALDFQHGVNAGEIVGITDSAIQIKNPRYGNVKGVRSLEMDLTFTGAAFKITTK